VVCSTLRSSILAVQSHQSYASDLCECLTRFCHPFNYFTGKYEVEEVEVGEQDEVKSRIGTHAYVTCNDVTSLMMSDIISIIYFSSF
jgi:hypothetical protein